MTVHMQNVSNANLSLQHHFVTRKVSYKYTHTDVVMQNIASHYMPNKYNCLGTITAAFFTSCRHRRKQPPQWQLASYHCACSTKRWLTSDSFASNLRISFILATCIIPRIEQQKLKDAKHANGLLWFHTLNAYLFSHIDQSCGISVKLQVHMISKVCSQYQCTLTVSSICYKLPCNANSCNGRNYMIGGCTCCAGD